MFRWIVGLVLASELFAWLGNAADQRANDTTANNVPTRSSRALAPGVFEGTGSERIALPADIDASARVVELLHGGSGSFHVWFLDGDGQPLDTLVDGVGDYRGVHLVDASVREHAESIEVVTTGLWKLELIPLDDVGRLRSATFAVGDATFGEGNDILVASPSPPSEPVSIRFMCIECATSYEVHAHGSDVGPQRLLSATGDGTTTETELIVPAGTALLTVELVDYDVDGFRPYSWSIWFES